MKKIISIVMLLLTMQAFSKEYTVSPGVVQSVILEYGSQFSSIKLYPKNTKKINYIWLTSMGDDWYYLGVDVPPQLSKEKIIKINSNKDVKLAKLEIYSNQMKINTGLAFGSDPILNGGFFSNYFTPGTKKVNAPIIKLISEGEFSIKIKIDGKEFGNADFDFEKIDFANYVWEQRM